jgi:hypothetical protein
MDKWTATLFALLAAVFVGVVIVERPQKGADALTAAAASADAGPAPGPDAGLPADAGSPHDGGEADGGEAALPSPAAPPGEEGSGDPSSTTDAGATLLSGSMPPPLAGDAPKSVVFGVILVQYRGAQGAPPAARTREAALDLAKQLAADAKTDFKAAIAKGDKGSLENAGRMPRGMLEPAPEYVLFSLPKDGVSEPVDTPRGYWIVHRIE